MVDYRVKQTPADFQVFEVMNLIWSPTNTGVYHYYTVNKLGYTTFEAVKNIAKYTGLPEADICYSGLKDEDGITSQYISLPRYFNDSYFKKFNEKKIDEKFINVRYLGKGEKPLKISNLIGNCFHVTIRNLTSLAINKILEHKEYVLFFINYYGSQRFGLPGQVKNTHLIGKALIENDYEVALSELIQQKSELSTIAKNFQGNADKFFQDLDKRTQAFFQSAYFSYLWNIEVNRYIQKMKLYESVKIIDTIEYKFLFNNNDILNLLKNYPQTTNIRVLFENDQFKNVSHARNTVIQTKIKVEETFDDLLNPNKYCCDFSFFLPSGCYATIALAQLMEKFVSFEENTNDKF
ncbi:MAG: tRNA pseudouridine(13) synthase TruD [Candidatus Aquirickettsiella gammari]|jgi:tRNA pseudouridine13 synthase|uniref:tRNA pseudouridine(13) synthase TruD n=1 Tax=Candidatus Aquirickettsiella gammari TaxID=2016198 RepID=A0A370CHX9_9COXI|nr:MAG: tRNA pseudouridine(13) synthase TruD [Candidatus Aquirickettsiella gammari]